MVDLGAGPHSELPSERVAGGMLPKVLNSFDMVAIFVSIVLFITNAAVIQSAGPSAFGWWVLGFLLFLIPGAIVTGQLGLMFPGEGSIYLWTQKAFGSFWGFFAGFCAWWPGVLVMVATGTVVLSFLDYVFPSTIGAASLAGGSGSGNNADASPSIGSRGGVSSASATSSSPGQGNPSSRATSALLW